MTLPNIEPLILLIATLNELGEKVEISPQSIEWARTSGALTTWDAKDGYVGVRCDQRPVGDA